MWYVPILDNLIKRLIPDPQAQAELQKEIATLALAEQKANQDFLARQMEAVAATMQAEAKSERWPQWAWRPVVGFTFAAVIINNYILMPYFQKYLQPIVIPTEVWNAMLMILGVAAATRGWQKIEQVRNGNGRVVQSKPGANPPPDGGTSPTENRNESAPFTSRTGFRREP